MNVFGRALVRVLLFAVVLTAGRRPVSAAPEGQPVRIALLATTADDPLAGRIEAELRALGFAVDRAAIPPEVAIDEVVRRQIAGGAQAAVVADGHRTDVWIPGAGAERVGLRQELEVDEASGLQSVLALRTVEFLRISLGLAAAPPPVAPVAPVPEPAPSPPRPPAADVELALDVSSGVLASAGRAGRLAVVGASLRARWAPLLGIELCGYAPLTSSDVTGAAGQAQTTVWLAGGGLLVGPRRSPRRLTAEGGVGAMAAVARSAGQAAPPHQAGTASGVGAVFYGRAAGQLRLGGAWALRLDLLAGWAAVRPVIIIGDQEAAWWGRPFVAALGGGEVRF